MKKYQFLANATSADRAYRRIVADANAYGIELIRCVAIYSGTTINNFRGPERVWQTKDHLSEVLVEY